MTTLRFAFRILAVIVFFQPAPAFSEGPRAKPLTEDECLVVFQKLSGPHRKPFQEEYVRRLPDGLTKRALMDGQRPIADAYNQLSENIAVALPILAASMEDDRFCYVRENDWSGGYDQVSVGMACRQIVSAHLDVYLDAVSKYDEEGRRRAIHYEPPQGNGRAWWHGRSVADLQLERIEWAARQPRPENFTEDGWNAARAKLADMAQKIRKNGRIEVVHKARFFSK